MVDPELLVRLGRVATKLAAAAQRPGEPVMIGASAHRFQFGPPPAEGEVTAFEREHGVSLPDDYRAFITTIGHDGPWPVGRGRPELRLAPAAGLGDQPVGHAASNTLATPFPAEPGRIYQDWPSEVAPGDDDEPYTGTLALSDEGCGYLSILVISGPARGRVADNSDASAGPNFTSDADFLGWYERWLDAVLAGATHFR